jgi:dienelactone hydrolase
MTLRKLAYPILLGLILQSAAIAEVIGKEVVYKADGISMKGYIASDNAISGKRPGILVVHEWWGQNAYARKRAEDLAALGYTALAVDMYGEGKQAKHPKDAGAFSKAVMSDLNGAKARFKAALSVLRSESSVDPNKIGAIGYCFGGGVVLNMARMGVDLKGVVSFHGSLGASVRAKEDEVKAAVLVAHGAADPFVPVIDIAGLATEMVAANVDYTFHSYPNAQHSFTNPGADKVGKEFSLPLAYNAEADSRSWEDMKSFFARIFK